MGEIQKFFQDKTKDEILSQLKGFKSRAEGILKDIDGVEKAYQKNIEIQDLIQKYQNSKGKYKDNYEKNPDYQNLLEKRRSLNINNSYLEGYRLLNEIGHFFNGEWDYTIVTYENGQNITFTFKGSDFLDTFLKTADAENGILRSSLEGFRFISNQNTLLANMRDTQLGVETPWKKDLQNSYENYKASIQYARSIELLGEKKKGKNAIADYNEGQFLEGFLSFQEQHIEDIQEMINKLENIYNLTEQAKSRHLKYEGYQEMKKSIRILVNALRKQTNSRGFWTGGDTKTHGQIKGQDASLFRFKTIRNQLEKFKTITSKLDFDKLKKVLESNVKPEVKKDLEQKFNEALSIIENQFNATRSNQKQIKKLDTIIKKIVEEIV